MTMIVPSGARVPVGEYRFRTSGPFFSMVSTFTTAFAGAPSVFSTDNPMQFEPGQTIELTGIQHRDAQIYPAHIHHNAVNGLLTKEQYRDDLCRFLANSAYESVKQQNDHSPMFEFFRHVRNASSHGNAFFFHPDEPSMLASWRGYLLDNAMKGRKNPMHEKRCFGAVLGPADLLLLMADIEGILLWTAPAIPDPPSIPAA